MALLFTVKKTARLPSIELTLTSTATYDLAAASSVNFVYHPKGGTGRTIVPLVTVDAPTKKVRLDLGSADVAVLGAFSCHVEVTIGGKVMCFPQKGFDEFQVTDTLE